MTPLPNPAQPTSAQMDAAYSVCRSIVRAEAKNFYYGFLVLPREKRDALSAVYAFMRHCDDLSDEAGMAPAERRSRLDQWVEKLHYVLRGEPTDDPVLLALSDAVKRYEIPLLLLDKLAEGTAMDVIENAAAGPIQYQTFEELYGYCYHVASVVGLICIKIFGYRDPAAELLAERCGIGFQLTNIIRDVKEDAAMGRVYLPEEDLRRFGRTARELNNGYDPVRFRPVLELEANRARDFYASAEQLLPLVSEDCRPGLWVLINVYRSLLEKIARNNYDVFGSKIRLTVFEKLAILSRGFYRRLTA
jgi:phytoene synthase